MLRDFLLMNDTDTEDKPNEVGSAGEYKHMALIAEITIFKACDAWAKAECSRQGIPPTGPNKCMVLGDCLLLVWLPTICLDDLVNIVFPSEMLSQEDKYSLLWETYSEDPVKVSPVKRVTSKLKVFLLVDSPLRPDVHEEYSPFQKSNVKYSVMERLGLTGIEVLSGEDFHPPTLH